MASEFDIGACQTPFEVTNNEMDSKLISVTLEGQTLITDQVFSLSVVMKNTGTAVWGQNSEQGERGASFLSRDPDYNDTFGTFFISPTQGSRVQPGEEFTYDAYLRAPSEPGDYTMTWQLVDWIIPYGNNYTTKPFFGEQVTVEVTVVARTEQPPPEPPHRSGVIDISDFEYEGSFSLPSVPNVPQDEKVFFKSGITLRDYGGEKRLLLTTGTYQQSLYEVAIPALGKFVGNDDSAVPVAALRTVFGELPKHPEAEANGTMWYDNISGLLYWTNNHSYYVSTAALFPVLRAARLD